MQATYTAIAGDVPLLLAALAVGLAVALVGSYLAGKVADALFAWARRLDSRATNEHALGRPYNYAADFRRASRLCAIAAAIDRTNLAGALYWRYRTIRARRKVRRRIDRLGR